ncbi:MAG: enoyl-CoA hydratase-related protein [Pseudazoarcus pumilus]|nr:enoyl-CoA hydratase-related protein [Pseudazoarcus pumilus]
MTAASISCHVEGAVARLRIARADALNALSSDMLRALIAALDQLAARDEVCVVIIESAGAAFCAGFDLAELAAGDSAAHREAFRLFNRFARRLQKIPQPVIARVQGVATAGGCQIVAMCDLAVASSEARFATSSIGLGLFGAAPAVGLSRNLGRKAAFGMLFGGDFIEADEALRLGLVNRVVAPDELDAAVNETALGICRHPPAAVRAGKQFFLRQLEMGIDAAHQLSAEVMAENLRDEEALRRIRAFLARKE